MDEKKQGRPLPPQLLKQLFGSGLDVNDAGGLGLLPGIDRAAHLFDGIGKVQREALESLGRAHRFTLRDIVRLFHHLGDKLDDTVKIVEMAGRTPDVTIQALIDACQPVGAGAPTADQVGQPMQTEAITVEVKTTDRDFVHVEFNKPVQFLVLSREAAAELSASILDGLLDNIAPDVDRADAPPMALFVSKLLESAAAEQKSYERNRDQE